MYKDIDELWREALKDVLNGETISPRGMKTKEIVAATYSLRDPHLCILTNHERGVSPIYIGGEFLWYITGSNSGEMITHYAPSYKRFLEMGMFAHGAYGKRWEDGKQLPSILRLLHEQPDTRQAVLSMWKSTDLWEVSAKQGYLDYPCTLNIQFLIRMNRLHCIVTMRSNDVWLGMPNDIAAFCMLQIMMADFLGIDVGFYHHRVGSLHLYEKNEKSAVLATLCNTASLPIRGVATIPHPDDFLLCIELAAKAEKMLRTKVSEIPLHLAYGLPAVMRTAVYLAAIRAPQIRGFASIAPPLTPAKKIPEEFVDLFIQVLGKELYRAATQP